MNNLLYLLIISILFSIYSGKITIISPPTLSNSFGGKSIPASYGNFGKISYGFSSRGKIIYNSEAQDQDPDYACKEGAINIEKIPLIEFDLYPIVLVKEGNCSFVQMTRNIQKAGCQRQQQPFLFPKSRLSRRTDRNLWRPVLHHQL